jgi:hypothetical protein
MFNTDLLIGGASGAAHNGAVFERRNPASGEVATRALPPRWKMWTAPCRRRKRPS